MSAATIDYDALAAQHGGTGTVDYDALAAQHGGTASALAPAQQSSILDPKGGWSPGDVLRGAATGIKSFVAHPLDTMSGMAQPLMASGVSPNGYPSTAATGRPQDSQANAQVQQDAQQGQQQAAQAIAKNPAYAIGSVAGPVALTAGIAKVAPIMGEGIAKLSPATQMQDAGNLLKSVANDANKVPVQIQNSQDAALSLMKWQKKTNLGPTVNKFLDYITNPKKGPLTYEDARDFYQVLGNMSVDENLKMPAPIKRDLTQLVVGLKQDIGDAADTVGRAADYYKGLQDYHTAKQLQDWYDLAKKYAIRGGLAAAGAAGVGTAARFFTEGMSK